MSALIDGSNASSLPADSTINGVTVGKGGGNVATNTAVGYQAINASATGTLNTAVGYQTLFSNTSGAANYAVGYQALYTNTTGSNNTAFGYQPLFANTTGGFNVAIGQSALSANTTASSNTAVGYQAMQLNTTGTQNTAMGMQAMISNTTGNYNVAIGGQDSTTYPALYANTTGASNVAVGNGSLGKNTTGSNNIAVGYQAAYNTSQNDNTAIGYQALYTNTSGFQNTVIGSVAGYSLTTGYRNTFIGPNNSGVGSGYYVTTGNNNTIIGAYSGNQGGLDIRTASNYIVLSDGAGNPRVITDNNGYTYFGAVAPISSSAAMIQGTQSGAPALALNRLQNGAIVTFYNNGAAAGNISNTSTTTSYNGTSDYRLKTNVKPLTGALETVKKLKPCTFDWVYDNRSDNGFIAHELQEVLPNAVTGTKDAVREDGEIEPQGIDPRLIVATLTAAIQELNAKVDSLKQQLSAK